MANKSSFRFYEELNDFLPPEKVKRPFEYHFKGRPSIKDAIEALGVPHTEVELILVNGESVGFDYHLQNEDRVSIYPVFETIDVSTILKILKPPISKLAFVLDVHLGKLARMLRMLGFDALYRNDYKDPDIIDLSVGENRIVLTRDRRLLCAKVIVHGYWLRSTKPETQVKEVIQRFGLLSKMTPFSRCLECNGEIKEVCKDEIVYLLQPKTAKYYDEIFRCEYCRKLYWKGSHYPKMKTKIDKLIDNVKAQ